MYGGRVLEVASSSGGRLINFKDESPSVFNHLVLDKSRFQVETGRGGVSGLHGYSCASILIRQTIEGIP